MLSISRTLKSASLSSRRSQYLYLVPSLLVSIAVVGVYLERATNPVYLGGLYFVGARAIAENGFVLPSVLPYYTQGGVPFAYPPLQMYVVAVLGYVFEFSVTNIGIFLPTIYFVALPVPLFLFATAVTDSPRIAGAAAVAFVVSPLIHKITLTGAGVLWSAALFWNISGMYVGVKLFRTGERRWFIAALLCWTFVLASHPVKSAWFGISYILLYLWYDRTVEGFARAAVVAIGGILLTVPWWGMVVLNHGYTVYLTAAGTHGGLFPLDFTFRTYTLTFPSRAWQYVGFLGTAALAVRRRLLLPVWYLITEAVIPPVGFVILLPIIAGAGIVHFADGLPKVLSWALRSYERRIQSKILVPRPSRSIATNVLFVCCLLLAVPGGLTAAASVSENVGVDADDRASMRWVARNTPSDAEFIVYGRYKEDWFPLYAERTVLLTRYGAEWETSSAAIERGVKWKVDNCRSVACIKDVAREHDRHFDYIFIANETERPKITATARNSTDYTVVYARNGTRVIRRDGEASERRLRPVEWRH